MNDGHATFRKALVAHRQETGDPESLVALAIDFLDFEPTAFERSCRDRHFTGSSLVMDPARTKILLTHHRKIGKWMQFGGHCDGIRDPFFVAWKETYEETGLKFVTPVSQAILGFDIHDIPEHGGVPPHEHYDVRYLFTADPDEPYVVSDESIDLAWVEFGRLGEYTDDSRFVDFCMGARHFRV